MGNGQKPKISSIFQYLIRKNGTCVICDEILNDKFGHLKLIHHYDIQLILGCVVSLSRTKTFSTNNKPKTKENSSLLECRYCKKPIHAKMNLHRHQSLCELIGKYRSGNKCLLCGTTENTIKKNPRQHFLRYHSENFNQAQLATLNQSRKLEERKKVKCKVCNLVTSSISNHRKICAELSKYAIGVTCKICKKIFAERKNVVKHFKIFHQNNQRSTKAGLDNKGQNDAFEILKEEDTSTASDLDDARTDKIEIKVEKEQIFDISESIEDNETDLENETEPKYNMVKSFQSYLTNQSHESRIVTKLSKCPICFAIFAFQEDIRSHLELYHKMPMNQFGKLGLKIVELSVSEFSNLWKQ